MTETYQAGLRGAIVGTGMSLTLILLVVITAPNTVVDTVTSLRQRLDLSSLAASVLTPAGAKESASSSDLPAKLPSAPLPSALPIVDVAETTGQIMNRSLGLSEPVEVATQRGSFELLESAFTPNVFAEPVSPATKTDLNDIAPLLETFSPESLRVIAQMTPDQIDALTLLLLSYADGSPVTTPSTSAVSEGQVHQEQGAPWIGDWSLSDLTDSEAGSSVSNAAFEPIETLLKEPWVLYETEQGEIFIELPGDPLSRIELAVGLVLNVGGQIMSIEKSGEEVLVRVTEGILAIAPRNAKFLAAEAARVAEARQRSIEASSSLEAAAEDETETPQLEELSEPPASKTGTARRYVQAGSFIEAKNAQMARVQIEKSGLTATVRQSTAQGRTWYRVLVRSDVGADDDTLSTVRRLGFRDAFWTRS